MNDSSSNKGGGWSTKPLSLQSLFEPQDRESVSVASAAPSDQPVVSGSGGLASRLTVSTAPPLTLPPLLPTDSRLIHYHANSAPLEGDVKRSNFSLFEGDGNTTTSYLTSRSWDPRMALHNIHLHLGSIETDKFRPLPRPLKLGTFRGVVLPCLLSMFRITMFVRLPWITGMAGIGLSLVIIAMAMVCTILTTISMSAIATNGMVPAGGPYYMISRSLGKEFGVAVGLLLVLATSVATSINILGAVEILTQYIAPALRIGSPVTDARVYGSVLLFVLACIALFGVRFMIRILIVFFISIVTAILAILVGLITSGRPDLVEGIIGFPGMFKENFPPGFQSPDMYGDINPEHVNFFALFAIFFPCVTGIIAGSNRSGDLANAGKSIPRGTLTALGTSCIVYLLFIFLFGTVCTGDYLRTLQPSTGLPFASIAWPHPLFSLIGCFIACLGSALQGLVGAPRYLLAVARDDIIPFLTIFKKTHSNEPRRALIVVYIIAQAAVLAGSLDSVASVTTLLFLICYTLINCSTALLSILKYPNWRPSWKYYHWTLSLTGSILCVVYMFFIHWIFSIISLVFVVSLYKYIEYRGAQVEWGDGLFALNLNVAQKNLLALERTTSVHAKNWRPQIMALVDFDEYTRMPSEPMLLYFLGQLRKSGGLSMVTSVLKGNVVHKIKTREVEEVKDTLSLYLKENNIAGFSQVIVAQDVHAAKLDAIQAVGIGYLRPNTILLAFPRQIDTESCSQFVDLLNVVMACDKVVLVLRSNSPFPSSTSDPFLPSDCIDVYWIMHDGGIMTLLPYLLRKHRVWRKCRLRIFCIAQEDDNAEQMERDLQLLLIKFRIEAEAKVVELDEKNICEFTYEKTLRLKQRESLLLEMRTSQAEILVNPPKHAHANRKGDKKKAEYMATSIKLNGLMRQHSSDASMVFCNLPTPSKDQTPHDYVAYLDVLTTGLQRSVLVKGSGMEVITTYF